MYVCGGGVKVVIPPPEPLRVGITLSSGLNS